MPANNWARLAEREQIHQEIGFTNINAITGFGGSPGSYKFSLTKPVLYRNIFILKFNKKNSPPENRNNDTASRRNKIWEGRADARDKSTNLDRLVRFPLSSMGALDG